MARLISIVAGTLILLAVGFWAGHRPVARMNARIERLTEAQELVVAEWRDRAARAEARGFLWQARAQLLLASHEVRQANFGTATRQVAEARELLDRAASAPGLDLDVSPVVELVGLAQTALAELDSGAADTLQRASSLLGTLLEQRRA